VRGEHVSQSLAPRLADHLDEIADEAVEAWIDWLESRVATRAIRSLPRVALRNHIPPVLRGVAMYVRAPLAAAREEMLGHLELHARLRRSQGYDLGELLAEFDGLAHLLDGRLLRWLSEQALTAPVDQVIEAMQRVATGMRAMGFVTADVFRDAELDLNERLSMRLEEFARTIAHEIRNPLHTLALGLTTLRSPALADDPDTRRHHLTMMEQALARAADLLDNVRQLALVESGRGRREQLGRLQTLHQVTFEELGLVAQRGDVSIELVGEVPDVSVDALAFQLSLLNLATNSIKYANPDASRRWVRVRYAVDDARSDVADLVVTVSDNGLGIAEEYQKRVFQRHVRAHPGVADGTGLGLAITRQVLLERAGRIELSSAPNEGTTVTFRLPCYSGDVAHRPTEEQPRSIVGMAVRAQLAHLGEE